MNKKLILVVLLLLPLPTLTKDMVTAWLDCAIGSACIVTGVILADQARNEYKKLPNDRIKHMLSPKDTKKANNNTITIDVDEVAETIVDKIKKYGWVYAKGVPSVMLLIAGYCIATTR